jgi:hypothetical protein
VTGRVVVPRAVAAWLLACALALLSAGAPAQDAKTSTVQAVARDFLALVDAGDYEGSWKVAGAKFRLAISPDRWTQAIKAVRDPAGKLTQRTMFRTRFTDEFPGVPKGEYAVVVFRTTFEKKGEGDETVTLERESDGRWHVIGYVVR